MVNRLSTWAAGTTLAWLAGAATLLAATPTYDLSLQENTQAPRAVAVEMEMGGELSLHRTAPHQPEPELVTMPVEVRAKLAYDELVLPAVGGHRRAARYYAPVEAHVSVDGRKQQRFLREQRRLLLARVGEHKPELLAVEAPLDRDELATLAVMADSLAIDQLLPNRSVAAGDQWQHTPEAIRPLTLLDTIGACDCQSVLTEANHRYALCQLVGVVQGVADGTSVELELEANYLVDHRAGRITKFNLAVREKRAIGPVTPGLDGVTKVRVTLGDATPDNHLSQQRIDRVASAYPVAASALETTSRELGFRVLHDTAWYTTGTRGKTMTLRRIDPAGLVAHASLSWLAPKPLHPERSMAEFRRDVAEAIGDNLAGIASDEQFTNQHGCRVMRVVAQGEVEGVPVEWHAYLLAPPEDRPNGDRLAITFTVETSELERLGGEDHQLVDRMELVEGPTRTAVAPGSTR